MVSSRIFVVLASLIGALSVASSSPCPSRELLYPCYCTSVPLNKKTSFTVITCSYIQKTSSLQQVYRTLRSMVIDRFILIDSFWGAEDKDSILPHNWMSLLRIKDLEIVDSKLSSNFACDISDGCPNSFLTHLTVRNSSAAETVNPLCENGGKSMYWTSCLAKIQHFTFSHNKLISFDKNVFPSPMDRMLTLNLSHNTIRTVGPSAFANLPKLTSLDLSNNQIKSLDGGILGGKPTILTFLDISWNMIKKPSADIFRLTPYLVTLSARGNQITELPEEHWKTIAVKTIKLIDLQDNFIECNCHLVWINCTLPVHTNILGSCAADYEDTPIRRVSKYMSERCTEKGVLEERVNKTKGNACLGWWKDKNSRKYLDNSLSSTYLPQQIQLPTEGRNSHGNRRRKPNP